MALRDAYAARAARCIRRRSLSLLTKSSWTLLSLEPSATRVDSLLYTHTSIQSLTLRMWQSCKRDTEKAQGQRERDESVETREMTVEDGNEQAERGVGT